MLLVTADLVVHVVQGFNVVVGKHAQDFNYTIQTQLGYRICQLTLGFASGPRGHAVMQRRWRFWNLAAVRELRALQGAP